MSRNILPVIVFFSFCFSSSAQTKTSQARRIRDHDSTYYISYRDQLTARTYLSRKYTTLKLTPPSGRSVTDMKYKVNTTLNLGIGATYRSLTLNIGVGIYSFNPENKKGETHYLDLQAHFYARKWNFDLLGQFYRGYYLTPKGLGSPDGKSYYTRSDLKVQVGGLAVYRALNDRRFSYQAGLVQNEWQRKSAGSILIGGEGYYGAIHGDSTLIPSLVDSIYSQSTIHKVHFFEMGPGIGYAYTFVFREHFFVLGSATVNIDFRYAREITATSHADKIDFTPNFIFHAGTGYNTRKWDLSLLWVTTQIHVRGGASDYKYLIATGNYRLIYARRFNINRKVKNILQPINELIEPK